MSATKTLLTIGAAVLVASNIAHAQAQTEPAPVLRTGDVLPGVPLQGPYYRIANTVQNDGLQNTFTVTVENRTYRILGNSLMRERLKELAAYNQLKAIKGTDVYGNALKKAATGPLRTAKNMVTAPVDTIKGIGSGIGTFFSNVGHATFGGASEQESGTLKTMLGFDDRKRQFAYRFGIDPYTEFEPVRKELDDVAWAGAAGGLTVSGAFMAIPGVGGTVVTATKTSDAMNRMVRDNTAAQLKEINAKRLRSMRVNPDVAELFLEHRKISPTRKTWIVEAIAQMGVYGREVFIKRAILSHSDEEAFMVQRWAEMCSAYHRRVSPVLKFVGVGEKRAPIMQRQDGVMVATVMIDYLAWTNSVAQRLTSAMRSVDSIQGVRGKEIWIYGTASPLAKKMVAGLGWSLKENASATLGVQ